MNQQDRIIFKSDLERALASVVDDQEQTRLIKLAKQRVHTWTRWWLVVFIFLFCTAALIAASLVLQTHFMYLGMIFLVVLFGAFRMLDHFDDRQETAALSKLLLLEGIRPSLCLKCRYDLRGTVAEQCPECGEPLAPPNDGDEEASQ